MDQREPNFSAMCYFPETGEFERVDIWADSLRDAAEAAKVLAAQEHGGEIPVIDNVINCYHSRG